MGLRSRGGNGGGGTHRDGTHGAGVSRSPPPLKLLSSTPKKRLTPPPPPPPAQTPAAAAPHPLRTRGRRPLPRRTPPRPQRGCPTRDKCVPPSPPPRPRPRLPAPPFSNTDSPSEPGEICQQFSTALVMTFLESASDGCKDRKAPRLSAWNNRSSVQSPIPLFSSFLPICPPPPPPPRDASHAFPRSRNTGDELPCLAPVRGGKSSLLAFVRPSIQPNLPVKDPKNMQGLHCR